MKTIIIIIVLILIGVGIYYFISSNNTQKIYSFPPVGGSSSQSTATPSASGVPSKINTGSQTGGTAVQTFSVSIQNFVFSPTELRIKAGSKVVWANNDPVAHQIASDSMGLFGSSPLNHGQSFEHVFKDVGTFSYHCAIHPTMKAKIVVE